MVVEQKFLGIHHFSFPPLTYQVLLRHHAQAGDMAAVRAVVQEAELIMLYPSHFLEIVPDIAAAGQSHILSEFLALMPSEIAFAQVSFPHYHHVSVIGKDFVR